MAHPRISSIYVKFLPLPSAIGPSCRGTQIILISSIYGLHRYENFATKLGKKNCFGNNGKGVLKLPFQNGAPIQRAILGGALEWKGTLRVPPQPGARGFAHPEPIGVTPLFWPCFDMSHHTWSISCACYTIGIQPLRYKRFVSCKVCRKFHPKTRKCTFNLQWSWNQLRYQPSTTMQKCIKHAQGELITNPTAATNFMSGK